jgi:hypothetical protein
LRLRVLRACDQNVVHRVDDGLVMAKTSPPCRPRDRGPAPGANPKERATSDGVHRVLASAIDELPSTSSLVPGLRAVQELVGTGLV